MKKYYIGKYDYHEFMIISNIAEEELNYTTKLHFALSFDSLAQAQYLLKVLQCKYDEHDLEIIEVETKIKHIEESED